MQLWLFGYAHFFSQLWINLKIKQSASKRKGPWGLLKTKVPCLLVEGFSLTYVVLRQYFPRSTDGKIWQHWKFLLPRTNWNKMLIMKTCQGQDVKWGQLDTFELKQYLKKLTMKQHTDRWWQWRVISSIVKFLHLPVYPHMRDWQVFHTYINNWQFCPDKCNY